jgi:hypothetical protein
MFIQGTIHGFMNGVVATLPQFKYLYQERQGVNIYGTYSPGLIFDERLKEWYVADDVKQQVNDLATVANFNYWIAMLWNRDTLQIPDKKARRFCASDKDLNTLLGQVYEGVWRQVPFTVVFLSNDPNYLISFEEMFAIKFDRSITLDCTYPEPLGTMPQEFNGLQFTEFTQVDRDTKGSMFRLGITFTADVPIVDLVTPDCPLIGPDGVYLNEPMDNGTGQTPLEWWDTQVDAWPCVVLPEI